MSLHISRVSWTANHCPRIDGIVLEKRGHAKSARIASVKFIAQKIAFDGACFNNDSREYGAEKEHHKTRFHDSFSTSIFGAGTVSDFGLVMRLTCVEVLHKELIVRQDHQRTDLRLLDSCA